MMAIFVSRILFYISFWNVITYHWSQAYCSFRVTQNHTRAICLHSLLATIDRTARDTIPISKEAGNGNGTRLRYQIKCFHAPLSPLATPHLLPSSTLRRLCVDYGCVRLLDSRPQTSIVCVRYETNGLRTLQSSSRGIDRQFIFCNYGVRST